MGGRFVCSIICNATVAVMMCDLSLPIKKYKKIMPMRLVCVPHLVKGMENGAQRIMVTAAGDNFVNIKVAHQSSMQLVFNVKSTLVGLGQLYLSLFFGIFSTSCIN